MMMYSGDTRNNTPPDRPAIDALPIVHHGAVPDNRRRPYTVVHISDPHLSRQFYREHFKSFKILLRTIHERGFDHLVMTGDITSTADEDDYYLVRVLLANHGLLDPARLTVVPGNHDIFGGPHRAIDLLSFPQHVRMVDYRRRFSLFHAAFRETFEGCLFPAAGECFPFVKRVGPFAIIGLNSVPQWSLRRNPLGSNGMLTDGQFDALQSLPGSGVLDGYIPIVALHHHFNELAQDATPGNKLWKKFESKTMRLRKRRKTIRIFENLGVRQILHGHIHRNELYETGGIACANGAGAVCDDPIPLLKFNCLTYDRDRISMQTVMLPVPYQVSTTSVPFQLKHRLIPELAVS